MEHNDTEHEDLSRSKIFFMLQIEERPRKAKNLPSKDVQHTGGTCTKKELCKNVMCEVITNFKTWKEENLGKVGRMVKKVTL